MRNTTRAERDGFNAAGFDIAFVNDGGVQVTRHIDSAGRNQVEAPRHCAQNRQRAGFLQFSRIDFDHLRFGRVVKNLRQIRASTALFINRRIQFVDDNAGDVGVFRAAEAAARQFDTLVQLFWRVGPLRHDKNDFRIQRFRDFIVQRLSELMFTGRNQTFNQHHFRVFGIRMVVRDDLFHQHVFLVAGEQRFNVAHLQRFSRRQGRVRANDSGVWSGASPPARGWAIGLKTLRRTPLRSIARMTPRLTLVRPTLVPVGISIIIRDTVYPLSLPSFGDGLQNSTASEAGGVKSGSQTARVLRDNQFFVGWDHHRRTGTFFVDETRFAEAGRQVTFVVDFKAQHAQFTQRQFANHRGVFTIPPVNTTASRRPSIRAV
ncbi:Uncharacterised protein [Salmonella enterica]|nr:Uncharacterised protein [Salmonella enterica]